MKVLEDHTVAVMVERKGRYLVINRGVKLEQLFSSTLPKAEQLLVVSFSLLVAFFLCVSGMIPSLLSD